MKAGTENRKKTIAAGALGAVALICVVYMYSAVFGGSDTTPTSATPAPMATAPTPARPETAAVVTQPAGGAAGLGATPGVPAAKLTSTAASLDPTLDEAAMLRTESLVYSGTGRNIFSASYTPVAANLPANMPPARPRPRTMPARMVPQGPPPPPPMNLKFFGTERHADGRMQAFFLSGDNVYLASQGDIIARKYKLLNLTANTAQVQDLENNNTQMLPLQQ